MTAMWTAGAAVVGAGLQAYNAHNQSSAPAPTAIPPPVTPGGSVSQYGGTQIDPVTGRVIYTDNTNNAATTAQGYQGNLMLDSLMGGNSAQTGLAAQIAAAKATLQQLQQQGSTTGSTSAMPAQFAGLQKYLDPKTGQLANYLSDPAGIASGKYGPDAQQIYQDYYSSTGGKYGKDGFSAWLKDNVNKAVIPELQSWQQTQGVMQGNSQTNQAAITAAQQRLDSLNAIAGTTGQTQAAQASNPLMNFLNQRNQSATAPDYMAMFANPNTPITEQSFKDYLAKAGQDQDSSALQIAGGKDPGMPDANAASGNTSLDSLIAAIQGGGSSGMGGSMMEAAPGYDSSQLGNFLNNQNRIAEKAGASNQALAQEQAARRGIIGGSGSDIGRLAAQQATQDAESANAAQGYGLQQAGEQNAFLNKFNVNAHNSDVVKGQALGQQQVNAQLASLLQQKFGNTLQAKQLYDQLQNQVWTNNQTAKQQNFANANTMLNQNTTLGQNQIANANQQTALDQQNFQDRMALQAQLLGQQNQTFNQGITQSNAALGQESLGANIAGGVANTANSATGANVASQNASNMANWQQGINANAATTNAFGQALQGAGYAAGNGNWGTDTTTGRTDGSAADQNAATSATPDWGDTGVSSSSLFAGTPSSTSTSTQPQSSSLFNTYAPVAQSTTAFNPYASTSTNTNPMGYGYIGSNVGGH